MKKWFSDKRMLALYIIVILFLVTGVTYALQQSSFAFNTNSAIIKIDKNVYGTQTSIDTSNLDMKPISDSAVESSPNNVIKVNFGVRGDSSNTTPVTGQYVYDVALTGIKLNCSLLSEDVKWKLVNNNTGKTVSNGSLSPKYDKIVYEKSGVDADGNEVVGGRLVLTDKQIVLPESTATADNYSFYMWISSTNSDQSNLFGKLISGNIEIETYNSLEEAKARDRVTDSSIDSNVCSNETLTDSGVIKNELDRKSVV